MTDQDINNSGPLPIPPSHLPQKQPGEPNSHPEHRSIQQSSQSHHNNIQFYSSYSGFQRKLSINSSLQKHQPETTQRTQNLSQQKQIVSPPGSPQIVKKIVKLQNAEPKQYCNQVTVKIEEPERKSSKKMYEFNQIYRNLVNQHKKSMLSKITRGVWSISSRKYQPKADIHQIFDEEELADSMTALDECKMWRNLMKKYIPKKLQKTRRRRSKATATVKLEKQQPQSSLSDVNRRNNSIQSNDCIIEVLSRSEGKEIKMQQCLQISQGGVKGDQQSIIINLENDQKKICRRMQQYQSEYLRGLIKQM